MSLSSSAPTAPTRAHRSVSLVKPEMSAKTKVPETIRQDAPGQSASQSVTSPGT
jgi:hypothetical protein